MGGVGTIIAELLGGVLGAVEDGKIRTQKEALAWIKAKVQEHEDAHARMEAEVAASRRAAEDALGHLPGGGGG